MLLPSLFLHGRATARLDDVPIASLARVFVFSTLAVVTVLVAAKPLLHLNGATFTSAF